jgi:hypothetical protein
VNALLTGAVPAASESQDLTDIKRCLERGEPIALRALQNLSREELLSGLAPFVGLRWIERHPQYLSARDPNDVQSTKIKAVIIRAVATPPGGG